MIPIGFYSLAFFGFAVFEWITPDPFWFRIGYLGTHLGVASALAVLILRLISRALGVATSGPFDRKRGLVHSLLFIAALILFSHVAIMVRGSWDAIPGSVGALVIMSLLGVILTAASGYRGWMPVDVMSPREHERAFHPRHV